MKLKFITSPKYRTITGEAGDLHIRGKISLTDNQLYDTLARGIFPTFVRGNFAFVFEGINETIAAVDHVSTYHLYYSNNHISDNFVSLESTVDINAKNEAILTALDVFGGHTFSTDTTNLNIQRLRNGHYLRHNTQHLFIDLISIDINERFDEIEFKTVVENVIRKGISNSNALLLSGGTDSVALAGIIRSIEETDKFDYLHIYADKQMMTEVNICKTIANIMNLNVTYFKIEENSAKLFPDLYYKLTKNWRDAGVLAKHHGMVASGFQDRRLLTGECGDQLFGGPKNDVLLKYCAQVSRPDPDIISNIWVNQSTRNSRMYGLKLTDKAALWRTTRPGGEEAYQSAREFVGNAFIKLSHVPYMTRFMRINLLMKGPYRSYGYCQDDLDWWSPFMDWEIVSRAITIPPETIMPNGMSKGILYNLWKSFLSDIPWKTSKIGINLPGRVRDADVNS